MNKNNSIEENTEKDQIEPVKPLYIETKLTKEQKEKCRNIVRVVKEYGLSQREIPYLVHLFALEHENRNFYVGISKLVGEITDCNKDPMSSLNTPAPEEQTNAKVVLLPASKQKAILIAK